MTAVLLTGIVALLKYESHRLFHKDATVLVQCTQDEWRRFQEVAGNNYVDPAHEALSKLALDAARAANVNSKPGGQVTVEFAAGHYHALGEAHEVASQPPVPIVIDTTMPPFDTESPEARTKAPEPDTKPPEPDMKPPEPEAPQTPLA